MTLDRTEMTKDDTLTVRVTLKNTGDRTGKEVVQLYLRDLYASAVRPVASLIGFRKVELAPGEETTVTFDVTEEMLRFYDLGCNFISEKGDFTLSVGYADHMVITKGFRLV